MRGWPAIGEDRDRGLGKVVMLLFPPFFKLCTTNWQYVQTLGVLNIYFGS